MLWEGCTGPRSDKSRSYHSGASPKNTISGSNGLKMVFSDLNHSLGRVESSDVVQNGRNYSLMVLKGCMGSRHVSCNSRWLNITVKRSDLVQNGRNTSPGVVGAL